MRGIELLRFENGKLDFFYYINNKFINKKKEKICNLSIEEIDYMKEHCNERRSDKHMTGYILFYDNLYQEFNKEILNRRVNKIIKLKERINEFK